MSLYDAITKKLEEEKKTKTLNTNVQKTTQPIIPSSQPTTPTPSKPITSILKDTVSQLSNMKPVQSTFDVALNRNPQSPNVGSFPKTPDIISPVYKPAATSALKGLSMGLQAADKVISPIVQPLRDWSQTPAGQAVKSAITSGGIGSLLNALPKTMVSPTKVTEPLQVLADRGVNSVTLGALDYLMPQTQAEKWRQENHPVAATVGTLGGYLIPGVGVEKGIMKALPKLAAKEGEMLVSRAAKRGTVDAISGGVIGGVEGGLNAAVNKQDILKGSLKGGLEGAAIGGALGGVIGGVGSKLEANKIFKKGLSDVSNSIDNYKFPQIREPNILPLPDSMTRGPRVSAEIPQKYRQPLPKLNEPLMLPEPKGTYLRPMGNKTFKPKEIDVPVTEKNIALKNKSVSIKGNISPSEYSNIPREDLLKLKKEMLNEKGKIFSEQVDWLNSKGSRGNKSTKGNLYFDEGGNVVGGGKGFSNNELWYQEWSKNNRVWNDDKKKWIYRKPTQSEIKEIAEKQLIGGVDSNFGQIPKNDYYTELSSRISKIDEILNTPASKLPDKVNVKQIIPYDVTTLQKKPAFNLTEKIGDLKTSKEKKNLFYVDPKFRKETIGEISPKSLELPKINAQKQALNVPKNEPNIKSPSSQIEPVKTQNIANTKVEFSNDMNPVGKNQFPDVGNMVKPIDNLSTKVEPDITTGKTKNRQFTENSALNSDIVPEELKTKYKEMPPEYAEISNQKTIDEAYKIIDKDYDGNVRDFLTKETIDDAMDTGKGIALIERAIQKGKIQEADDLIVNLAEKLTKAGQGVQMASVMKRMSPGGMLKRANQVLDEFNKTNKGKSPIRFSEAESSRIVNNMKLIEDATLGKLNLFKINLQLFAEKNKSLAKRLKELADADGNIDFSKDTLALKQFTDEMVDDVAFITANKLPSTKIEKFNAWRRMAMLANPKTHIKNLGGNLIMAGLRKTADTIGAGLEKVFIKNGERTKSFGWSRDKDLVDAVNRDWDWHKNALKKGGKWEFDSVFLNQEKPIFETKFLESMNRKSIDLLNASDNIFLQSAYKDALGGYMKSNGLKEVTNEARLYATRRGYEAVFKQANAFSNWISKMKSKGGVLGTFLEAKLPFTKTPSNIVLRGVEYSPLGILKAMYSKATGKTAVDVIEDLSKGLTGTGIYGLGMYLAAMGWAKAEGSKSAALENVKADTGEQPYSIKTPFGSYTFDFAQPTSIPLAMGIATIESLMKNKQGEDSIGVSDMVMKGLASGGDTLFNTTMLRNVTDMFGGKYGSPSEAILNYPAEYFQQAMPSLMGQLTRSIDPVKRDTSGGFMDLAKSKVPFLSKTLPAKVDVYGREQKQPSWYQQFFSPGYGKLDNNDKTSEELVRLNKSVGTTDFIPKFAQDKISYQAGKNETKKLILPPKLKEEYAKKLGTAYKQELDKIIGSTKYNSLPDKDPKGDSKAKMLESVLRKVKEEVDNKFVESQGAKEYKSSSGGRSLRGGRSGRAGR